MILHETIHATFVAAAARHADRVALASDDATLTYAQLDRRSEQIARYLLAHGVTPGARIGLYAQRSVATIAVILGVLKSGAAYVPFDPAYPAGLLKFVYGDCAPTLMLVQPSLLAAAGTPPFWGDDGRVHDIDTVFAAASSDAEPGSDRRAPPRGDWNDLAYIMYTSGSTGHPKGVLIPHRGVVRLAVDNTFARVGPGYVHLQLAPLAFDASTFEIWGALLNGGTLAILPNLQPSLDDIAAAIARHHVTTLWLTAGLFHLMVEHRLDGLRPLNQLLAGGDVLSPTHIARALAALPDCTLINGYGPTENTTFTCCYTIPRPDVPSAANSDAIPIGTPIAHTEIYLLDEHRHLVAEGCEGELYAGGLGVGLGYLNRPELTAERFVPNPFDGGATQLYRTGDRVRRRADGNVEFLGRVDRQVKINGKRVELDEVEAVLRRDPSLADAAVTSHVGTDGARKILAFVKPRGADFVLAALKSSLQQELPDYMLPASFTVMESFPLSPTGKVDRSKLAVPAQAAGPGAPAGARSASIALDGDLESQLMEIWRTILDAESVGLNDNFFDLGGSSMQLLRVHATIVSRMHTDLTLVDLYQFPRISALAARLRGKSPSNAPSGVGAGGAPAKSAMLNADERAQLRQAALARARAVPGRNVR